MSELDFSQFTDVSDILLDRHCVYMLYSDNELVYIGMTTKLYNRVNEHRRKGKFAFNRVLVKYVEDETQANALEYTLIRDLQPRYNIQYIEGLNNKQNPFKPRILK